AIPPKPTFPRRAVPGSTIPRPTHRRSRGRNSLPGSPSSGGSSLESPFQFLPLRSYPERLLHMTLLQRLRPVSRGPLGQHQKPR
ncbi:hypothetical protein BX616_010563, partial [Lobosporangium transversale]